MSFFSRTPKIKVLNWRQFESTLIQYRLLHKNKTEPQIVNKKALFISRRAIIETVRPSKGEIQKGIGRIVFDMKMGKTGKGHRVLNKRTVFGPQGQALADKAPVGALIVNFIRGRQGLKGLHGSEMRDAINRLVGNRIKAIAFLAAGWIPAVKKLSPLVYGKAGAARDDQDAKKIKKPKGSVVPAHNQSGVTVAKIINEAISHFTTTKDPLGQKALPALQKAIDYETISMRKNIEDEMRKSARSLGIKTN